MKKFLILAITLAVFLSLTACGLSNLKNLADDLSNALNEAGDALGSIGDSIGNSSGGDIKSRSEIESQLSNYKITYEYSYDGDEEDGYKYSTTEMRCDEGYMYFTEDDTNVFYVEYGTGKYYMLDTSDKTGISFPMDEEMEELYSSFGTVMGGFLFAYDGMDTSDFEKVGSERVAGRSTTVYQYKIHIYEYKFWFDDEYGLTLKYFFRAEDNSVTFEVTDIKLGGVRLSDYINLSQYDIIDYSNYGD